jgi:hypothetical protein
MRMKQCNHCGEWKNEEEFAWRWKKLGKRQSACRDCRKKQNAASYHKHKTQRKRNVREYKREVRKNARAYIWDYLSTHPCVDCGESDPTVLEFDHVRGRKKYTVSAMANQGLSIDRIQKEIDKCEVRCANCHRRKTSKERGWFRG